MYILD